MARDLLTALWSAQEPPALSARDWELLLSQARAARLTARMAWHFQSRGWQRAVPERCRPHLESAQRVADRLGREVLCEGDHLRRALRGLPTPIVLLKGAAYVAADLPPGRGRLFSDVDVMVRRDQLRAVELALLAAGWVAEKLTPYDDRYYRRWMHELPPLQHVARRTFLDVHHTIAPPTSRFAIDGARLLERCVALPTEPALSILAPTDMVLHSAVHLMQEGQFHAGLRDLLDLNDLMLHFGKTPGFWSELVERARELGVGMPLGHTLVQLTRLLGNPVPPEQADAVRALLPTGMRRAAMQVLMTRALQPDHPSCRSPASRLSRWLLYVRSHWLRMPWYQIAPHLWRKGWMRAMDRLRRRQDEGPSAA